MKRLFVVILLSFMFIGSGIVFADNEGTSLGAAWNAYNSAAAFIAVKDANNDWKYNQSMIDTNADAATNLLVEASDALDAIKNSPIGDVNADKAKAKTGNNSIQHLQYLISRAEQAITKGADSFDKQSASSR